MTPRARRAGVAVLFICALALALAIATTLKAGPRLVASPASIDVPGSAMQGAKGRVRVDGQSIVVQAVDADGLALVVAPVPAFDAEDYTRITWRIASATSREIDIAIVWRTRERPDRTHTAPIDWTRGPATIDLSRDPRWSGSIQGVALAVRGRLQAPLVIDAFSARSNAWTTTLADIVAQWMEWPRTSGRMSVSHLGDEARHVAPIVTVVAGGVALGFAFLAVRARRRREPLSRGAIAALFLAGWLVLDARWQTILWRQHAAAVTQFAGKTLDEQHEADVDAPIFDVARRIRDAERAKGGRMLVLSNSPHLRTRVAWFLYPENVFNDTRPPNSAPPAPDRLLPGDQVVLLLYSGIRWDAPRGMLVWNDGRTRAAREILSDGPDFAVVEVR